MKTHKIFNLVLAFVFAFSLMGMPTQSVRAAGPLCYVDDSAGGANNGTSWADAYIDLQSALADTGCTEIWAAAGTYKPASGLDRTISFVLKNGVAIYGGFAGTETQRDERDWVTNETILSGDLNNNDVGFTNNAENSYHVVKGGGTDNSAVLDGFTIRGGNADGSNWPDGNGGGMYNDASSPTLANLTISGNAAFEGGGIFNDASSPRLTNVIFENNTAINSGGGMYSYSYSHPDLINVRFNGNTATYGGGMYNANTDSTLTNVTFEGNTAEEGGGLYNGASNPTLMDVTFTNNAASSSGGGMHNENGSDPTLTRVTFNGNTAAQGGGIANTGGDLQIIDGTLLDNSATGSGGGVFILTGSLTSTGTTFSGNSTSEGSGGAMYSDWGSITLTRATITENFAQGGGGGISVHRDLASLNIVDSLMENNTTNGMGGAISSAWGPIQITGSTIRGNSAGGGGGGIWSPTSLTITSSLLANNTATNQGGAITAGGVVTITNSTISGNSAGWIGGGIANGEGTVINIDYTTITNNVADSDYNFDGFGGGLSNYLGTVNLKNSILAGNISRNGSAPDCSGEFVSQDHNLIQNLNGCTITPGTHDIVGRYAALGLLADNGGPTQTHALLRGSPAIEAANPSDCLLTDQRGVTRPQETHCDIGAYELVLSSPNAQPIAEAGGPYTAFTGQTITLDASASSDPDGDSLTYEWDLDNDGEYDDATGVTTATVFNQVGEYTVGLRVTDTFGLTNTDTATVTVSENIPSPGFGVRANDDEIEGWWWPQGAVVNVTIEDLATPESPDYHGTAVVNIVFPGNDHRFKLRLNGIFDIVPGHIVTVSDGNSTRHTTVTGLSVTDVNAETDVVSGVAAAGSLVHLWVHCTAAQCANRHVFADSNGNWSADFSVSGPGSDPSEQVLYDIVPGTQGDSAQWDMTEDGGGTSYFWRMPNPNFAVYPVDRQIYGWEWKPLTAIQITAGTCPASTLSDQSGNFYIQLPDDCTLQAGDNVTVTDGFTTKAHVITSLVITSADAVTDIVHGTAEPGSIVNVWICDQNGCTNRHETTDANGNWTANFAAPGDQPDEQTTFDLQLGSGGDAVQSDMDADSTGIRWQVPNPIIWGVIASSNWINGLGWPRNVDVQVSIDDPSTLQNPDSTATQATDANGNFIHQSLYDISIGSVVSVTDGNITKQVAVSNFEVTAFDANALTVSGIGTPNANAAIWITDPGGQTPFVIDSSGHWQVEISGVADITPWSRGFAIEQDADGDGTQSNWPTHYIQASINRPEHSIEGYDWLLGSSITLTIDNPGNGIGTDYTDIQIVELGDWGETRVQFDLGDFRLETGALVTLTDGTITKTHTVAYLDITAADTSTDRIFGKANPGSTVQVESPNHSRRNIVADQSGDWMADFSTPGQGNDEQGLDDIQEGRGFTTRQYGDGGNSTRLYWMVPDPKVIAYPDEDVIAATDFWPGTPVTITVDDPGNGIGVDLTRTGVVDIETGGWQCQTWWGYCFVLDLRGEFDVQAGQIITITYGTHSVSHVVTTLSITNVDLVNSTVSGTAEPLSEIQLDLWPSCGQRHLFADSSGNWLEDFSIPGDEDFEQEACNFSSDPLRDVVAYQGSGEGETWVGWYMPTPPTIAARPGEQQISGYDWPEGATITLAVDNPSTPQSPDYTDTLTSDMQDWGQTEGYFDLRGKFFFGEGDIVTMTDGTTTKMHTVTSLDVTSVDADNDLVYGVADPGEILNIFVWIPWPDSYAWRDVVADSNGEWVADFSIPVDGMTYDITDGTFGEVLERDQDEDFTNIYWYWPMAARYCAPGDTVSGTVFEHDGITPVAYASLAIQDYATGGPRFIATADQNGTFTCALPNGEYRIMANAENRAMEYYDETRQESAARLSVTTGTQITGINFTLALNYFIERFTFNFDNPLLQDLAIRQAIAFGTDRERILNEAFLPNSSYGNVVNSFASPGSWAEVSDSELDIYLNNPQHARDILEAAGWVDTDSDGFRENAQGDELAFTFKTTWAAPRLVAAEIFRQNMADIGIRITTSNLEPAEFFDSGGVLDQGDFDIAEFATGSDYEEDLPGLIYVTGDVSNYGNYSNPAFDAEIADANAVPTLAEKLPFAFDAQKILAHDLPAFPLFTRISVTLITTFSGSNITVSPASSLTVRFDNVTQSGVTGVSVSPASPASPPAGFELLGMTYNIGTTAVFTGEVHVCITYDASGLTPLEESGLRLYHMENDTWTNVTDADSPDTAANQICGTVTSLSPFAVMQQSDQTPPVIPSNFYGEIHVLENPPTAGGTVEVFVPGMTLPAAVTTVISSPPDLVYVIDVPGDLPDTQNKEGGLEGDVLAFKIGGRVVATGIWHSGTSIQLDFHPPEALSGGPYSGDEGSPIVFSGSRNDWASDAATYYWDWDNNGTHYEAGPDPSQAWADNGTYTVGLKVIDSQGGEGTTTFSVTVYDVLPSSVNAGGPYSGIAGQPVTLNGSAICAQTDNCSYAWDLDGDTEYDDATGAGPAFTWNTVGDFSIGLLVSDDDGNTATGTATVHISGATHGIALERGWNLVSFNVHPANTSITNVLSSIAGNYSLVYAWDATGGHSASGNWMKYSPTAPSYSNTLSNLNETMGFWIHMTSTDTLEVEGSIPSTTNITLSDDAGGWNLAAYPSAVNRALPAALSENGVGNDFSLVYSYRANDTTDSWKLFGRTAPTWANDLTELSPGWGYWVKVNADPIWSVSYPAP